MLNLTAPLRVMEGDMAIMTPGLAVMGQPMASCSVTIELVSRCEMRNAPPLNVPTSLALVDVLCTPVKRPSCGMPGSLGAGVGPPPPPMFPSVWDRCRSWSCVGCVLDGGARITADISLLRPDMLARPAASLALRLLLGGGEASGFSSVMVSASGGFCGGGLW